MWEIAGVDEAVIEEFSSRHRDIREIRDALEAQLGRPVTDGEDDASGPTPAATRPPSTPPSWSPSGGNEPNGSASTSTSASTGPTRAIVFERLDDDAHRPPARRPARPRSTGCAADTDRFDRGDVVRAIVDWSIDDGGQRRKVLLPPVEIERLADEFLTQRQVIALVRSAEPRRDPPP